MKAVEEIKQQRDSDEDDQEGFYHLND
jgi:hypothetical protein